MWEFPPMNQTCMTKEHLNQQNHMNKYICPHAKSKSITMSIGTTSMFNMKIYDKCNIKNANIRSIMKSFIDFKTMEYKKFRNFLKSNHNPKKQLKVSTLP